MDPAAEKNSAGLPTGAVSVPVEAAAGAAAPPAGAPAAGARPAWTRVSARVMWAGAAAPPAGAAGALVVPVAAAAAARAPPAWTRLSARLPLAAALFLVGCAEAGLALLAVILPPGKFCAPTDDAEMAGLRTGRFAAYLILGVSAQVLAATMAVVPAWEVAVLGTVVGMLTAYVHANDLWLLVVACHGSAHGEPAFYFWLFYVVLWPVFAIGAVVSLCC